MKFRSNIKSFERLTLKWNMLWKNFLNLWVPSWKWSGQASLLHMSLKLEPEETSFWVRRKSGENLCFVPSCTRSWFDETSLARCAYEYTGIALQNSDQWLSSKPCSDLFPRLEHVIVSCFRSPPKTFLSTNWREVCYFRKNKARHTIGAEQKIMLQSFKVNGQARYGQTEVFAPTSKVWAPYRQK